jgi:Reverse transcriptase (RNA-dependent DNA polymerase)
MRDDDNGTVYMGLYIDDLLLVGNQEALDQADNDLQSQYQIKDLGTIKEYVCETVKTDKNEVKIKSSSDLVPY